MSIGLTKNYLLNKVFFSTLKKIPLKNAQELQNLVKSIQKSLGEDAEIEFERDSEDQIDFTEDEKFSFGFVWSGWAGEKAQFQLKSHSAPYRIVFHPKLNFYTADLISTLTSNEQAGCIANAMAGKLFLEGVQSEKKSFSPHGTIPLASSRGFRNIHSAFFDRLPDLEWLNDLTFAQTESLEKDLKLWWD